MLVAPSLNVTSPTGVPPGLVTVAVNVTVCFSTAGCAEELTVVVVGLDTHATVTDTVPVEPPFNVYVNESAPQKSAAGV